MPTVGFSYTFTEYQVLPFSHTCVLTHTHSQSYSTKNPYSPVCLMDSGLFSLPLPCHTFNRTFLLSTSPSKSSCHLHTYTNNSSPLPCLSHALVRRSPCLPHIHSLSATHIICVKQIVHDHLLPQTLTSSSAPGALTELRAQNPPPSVPCSP